GRDAAGPERAAAPGTPRPGRGRCRERCRGRSHGGGGRRSGGPVSSFGKTSPGSTKAVIYCRVSTKEQTQNLSLPTQRRACEQYCDRHGLEVVRVFVEEGESAKTTERP